MHGPLGIIANFIVDDKLHIMEKLKPDEISQDNIDLMFSFNRYN